MTLGILASGNLGYELLKKIHDNHQIKFVLSDNNSVSIHNFCSDNNIPNFNGNPRQKKGITFIKDIQVDVIASINYLFIIDEDIINHSNQITFNIHGSLLPKYRGRTPHVWAIINGEKEAGITVHKIDSGCDTGEIIKQKIIEVKQNDTGGDLLLKYQSEYFNLIEDVLHSIKEKTLTLTTQNNEEATYFEKRTPKDGAINWEWQKERIRNWVRAQALPYPGAFTHYKNEKIVIDEIEFSNLGYHSEQVNGTILTNKEGLVVKCQNGAVLLKVIRNHEKLLIPIGSTLN
jgi:methionyl-tRNA formyltransferase